ncbi:unnamed protein product [Phytomonas sp. Hart1]|nr:unnamed protein product [Phytomonas sp. Hart1]|eukprot:CCW69380.1 unnamed protein product [Phytomonas sp. isolate Hart1]
MGLFRLTRYLASSVRFLSERQNTDLRKRSKLRRNRMESNLSSSNTAEAALSTFYSHLNDTLTSTHPIDLTKLHCIAGVAMRECLRCGSAREAIAVYYAFCRCGLSDPISWFAEGNTTAEPISMEKMALEALHCLPHRVWKGTVVSQLVMAEAREKQITEPPQSHPPGLSSKRTTSSSAEESATFSFDITQGPKISTAERFRIDLHRNIQLLCTSKYLQLQIGRNFLFKKMHDIEVSTSLQEEVEVQPMCLLSSGVLWHPFAYSTPTMPWAQRLSHFDNLGPSSVSVKTLSEVQLEGLESVWESTASLRSLCRSALLFLTSLATEWDQIFLKRISETLILPDQAHNIFPISYNRPQLSSSFTAQVSAMGTDEVDVDNKWELSPRKKWTDPTYRLFTSVAVNSPEDALQRAELIVKRRIYYSIVVPDAPYILLYFNQLQQMGRHREIVLTHGVLLDILRVALLIRDPRRFNARRVLRALMLATTTTLTKCNFSHSRPTNTIPPYKMQDGGVTVLGLQDELALLNICPERLYIGESELAGDALGGLTYSHALQRPEQQSRSLGYLSAVLVAKQLERMVKAHRKGLSFATVSKSEGKTPKTNISQLMNDIDDYTFLQTSQAEESFNNHKPQLFKNKPRPCWSRNSVVVATTSSNTRSLAFTIGINTFPPISVS